VDVWEWVTSALPELSEAGHGRLADLLIDLPTAAVDGQAAQAEAMAREALALARAIGSEWIEIYVRHWDLQARSGGHADLPDAVELFEFAHRERNLACPQSVCAVQDLTLTYAATDNVGFAPERLEVSAETLRRIDPSWQCFSCITSEHADALLDSDRPQEALDFLAVQSAAAVAAGSKLTSTAWSAAAACMALGRLDEAMRLIDDADPASGTNAFRLTVLRASCHAARGELDLADGVLPGLKAALAEPSQHVAWVEVAEQLVDGPWANDWRLGVAITELLGEQVRLGRARDAVEIAAAGARLALRRDALPTAARALHVGRSQVPRLAAPHGADELLDALQRSLDAAEPAAVELLDSPEAVLAELGRVEGRDPEREADMLTAAAGRWPDASEIAGLLAEALQAVGATEEAEAALWDWVERHPADRDMRFSLAAALVDTGRTEDAERLAADIEGADAAWIRANVAMRLERYDEALAHASVVCDALPDARGARHLAALAALEARDWTTALQRIGEAIELDAATADAASEDGVTTGAGRPVAEGLDTDAIWAQLVAASALGQWDLVRAGAAQLGMSFASESGPIDEPDGWIRVRFGDGAHAPEYIAERIGPVTARVIEVAPMDAEQHVDDVVLLDFRLVAAPEATSDASEEAHAHDADGQGDDSDDNDDRGDGDDPDDRDDRGDSGDDDTEDDADALSDPGWTTWRVLEVLSAGGKRAFELDGLRAGDDVWDRFAGALRDRGWAVDRRSDDLYVLAIDDELVPGVFARVAVPTETSDADACALLARLVAELELPELLWPALAESAGDAELGAHQRERAAELGIDLTS